MNACESEQHSGESSNNQNDHIFLDSGISLYRVIQALKFTRLYLVGDLIEEQIGLPPNLVQYEKWERYFDEYLRLYSFFSVLQDLLIFFVGLSFRSCWSFSTVSSGKERFWCCGFRSLFNSKVCYCTCKISVGFLFRLHKNPIYVIWSIHIVLGLELLNKLDKTINFRISLIRP